MSFSSQRAVCYFINQFNNWLLIVGIKTPAVFKQQRFDNSESEEIAPIVYKHQQFDKHDNEEKQSLDEDKGDGDEDRYVLLSSTAFLLLLQKKSNHLSDLGEKIRSLTHLVCISKNY